MILKSTLNRSASLMGNALIAAFWACVPSVGISQTTLAGRISSVELIPRIKVNAPVGETVEIYYSETLDENDWHFLKSAEVTEDPFYFYDESRTQGKRFYRVGENPPAGPPGYVWIPPGEFMMGSPESEEGRNADEILHPVRITYGFWMKETEVTQGEFAQLMGWSRHSGVGPSFNKPVSNISYNEANDYISKKLTNFLNAGYLPSDYELRLPTEAEWEYACRSGTQTRFWWGDEYSRSRSNIHIELPQDVKSTSPNFFGLYEMHGNVREMCVDAGYEYSFATFEDPYSRPHQVEKEMFATRSWHGYGSILLDAEIRNVRAARRSQENSYSRQLSKTGFRPVISRKSDLLNHIDRGGRLIIEP